MLKKAVRDNCDQNNLCKNKNIFKVEAKSHTTATAESIWKLWADVDGWKNWDTEVECATIDGEFNVGSKGVLKAKGAPKSNFAITEATPNMSFTSRSRLPLCTIDFIHTFENGVLSHRIEMRGITTFFFSKVAGKSIAKTLPGAVANLIKHAER